MLIVKNLYSFFFLTILLIIGFSSFSQVSPNNLTLIEGLMYKNGTSEPFTGLCVEKYENGKKGMEGNYKEGKKEGLWVWWYQEGKKKRESNYVNDKKHGLTTYWFKNGHLQSESKYENDELHGKSTWYFQNGQKKKSAVYNNGLFIGSIVWDETGNVLENNLPKDN
ncbi:MAG TPA: hypothetical protein DDX39_09850 [Bacteroidales bacterium]|nr:MAG: hypothetical protein A2W98_01525 [Bacteroidetes bacterium GWF2_33_38]OFY72166.1 MAG: hypothetical protein A2265_08645 [Bacteroidetes bacterium RIFOXYA12_FULL_33_9]OFY86003.1 MAG: hypothetical protein A2236_10870 [Bacteroidetes bacterium RIFOXYA2_FULL_33_7]HBF88932.1 hypothetical protein [Bacteroidales bacterium]